MHTLISWQQAGKYYNHNGNKVFYIEEGAGDTIVFLHGYPTAGYDWKYIWDDLKADYKLIALDFIGFGFSDKPRDLDYSIHGQTDMVVALLNSMGITRFYLIAHDYAVSVAQELMTRQKDNQLQSLAIQKVCLLNGGLISDMYRPVMIQKVLLSPIGPLVGRLFNKKKFEKSFGQIFAPDKKPTAQQIDEFWALVENNGGKAIIHKLLHYIADRRNNRNRWLATLQNPPVPVRLVYGLLDPISGKHLVDWYKDNIPNPDVVELPLNGHYPQVENPAEVLKAIKAFLQK